MNAPPFARLNVEQFAVNVPRELVDSPPQWVPWKPVWRKDKYTKPPINAHSGGPAEVDDPKTWAPLADCIAYCERHTEAFGVGFVLVADGGLVAFDFDDCLTADREIIPDHFAAKAVPVLNSYTEVTPSGTGLRVFVHGVLPDGSKGRKAPKLNTECYGSLRYVTVSGNRLTEYSSQIEHRQAEIDQLFAEVFPSKPEPPPRQAPSYASGTSGSDDAIMARAMASVSGAKFRDLYNGNWQRYYASQSEADLALCSMLYFFTGGDRAAVERLFSQSGLSQRDKWVKRADYRATTLDCACQGEVWTPNVNGRASTPPVADAPRPEHRGGQKPPKKKPNSQASAPSYPAPPPPDRMQAIIADPRPKLLLSGGNRLLSAVAAELSQHLKDKPFFCRNQELVALNGSGELHSVSAQTFRTLVERYVIGYRERRAGNATYQLDVTMTSDEATGVIASPQFLEGLRPLVRLNRIRKPVQRANGVIELLPEGYDSESRTLTISDVSYDEDMPISTALEVLADLYGEFTFADEGRSKAVAVAALLGLYSAQLLPQGSLRPCFVFTANCEGAGKTTLVLCATIPILGVVPTGASPENESEMRKALTTTVREASPILFLDNVKGRLSSASLEAFTSTPTWKDRLLGLNKSLEGPNLATVFVTENGCTMSSDMGRRSLFCGLHLSEERAEDRKFIRPLSLPQLLELRPRILAACWALVRNWDIEGRPQPRRSHSHCPQWAATIGGIVEAAGYACPLDPAEVAATADEDTESMKLLVQAMMAGKDYTFADLVVECRSAEAFPWLIGGGQMDPAAKSTLGWVFARFDHRWVGGEFFIIEGKGHKKRFRIRGLNEKVN